MKKNLFNLSGVLLLALAPAANANLINNGSFENVSPTMSVNEICAYPGGAYYSSCTAAGWTGNYQIGNGATIGIGGSSFNIPPDPDGSQALILQGAGSDATEQITAPKTGLYTLTFYGANRSTAGLNGPQTLEVLLNNSVIPGATYTGLPYSWTEETITLDLTAGSNSLTFETTRTGDRTDFVDAVSLVPEQSSSVPEPSSLSLLLCGGLVALAGLHRRSDLLKRNRYATTAKLL